MIDYRQLCIVPILHKLRQILRRLVGQSCEIAHGFQLSFPGGRVCSADKVVGTYIQYIRDPRKNFYVGHSLVILIITQRTFGYTHHICKLLDGAAMLLAKLFQSFSKHLFAGVFCFRYHSAPPRNVIKKTIFVELQTNIHKHLDKPTVK